VSLQSYVNCALGVHRVGFVIVAYGAVSAVTSLVLGHITDTHIRRVYVVVSGAVFNGGLLVTLAWWRPRSDDPAMFYVVAGCLGLCDAIWQTQTNSKQPSSFVVVLSPLHITHLISPGRSHGGLRRTTQFAKTATNHSVISSDEMRSRDMICTVLGTVVFKANFAPRLH